MTTMASQITSLTVVYSIVYSGTDQRNTKAPRHWPLCGEFTGTGEFPAQRASNAENASILWRHHDSLYDKRIPVFHEGRMISICHLSVKKVIENANIYFVFLLENSTPEGSQRFMFLLRLCRSLLWQPVLLDCDVISLCVAAMIQPGVGQPQSLSCAKFLVGMGASLIAVAAILLVVCLTSGFIGIFVKWVLWNLILYLFCLVLLLCWGEG